MKTIKIYTFDRDEISRVRSSCTHRHWCANVVPLRRALRRPPGLAARIPSDFWSRLVYAPDSVPSITVTPRGLDLVWHSVRGQCWFAHRLLLTDTIRFICVNEQCLLTKVRLCWYLRRNPLRTGPMNGILGYGQRSECMNEPKLMAPIGRRLTFRWK